MDKIEAFKDMIKPGSDMDFKKSLKKLWIGIVASVLVSGIAYGMEFIQAANIDIKYTFLVGLAVAILYGVSNAVKHWKDQETIEE